MWPLVCVWCTCVWLVPDVAVEDFSEGVENTNHRGHRAEEDDPGHRSDALQHRVHPHSRHLVHPTRPGRAGTQKVQVNMHVVKIKPFLTLDYTQFK